MSNISPTVARQALRLSSRRQSAAPLYRLSPRWAATLPQQARRNYVSETKSHNATVNIDSTIKADQKAFFKETGKNPADAIMPSTGMSADAMMSPQAGKYNFDPDLKYRIVI